MKRSIFILTSSILLIASQAFAVNVRCTWADKQNNEHRIISGKETTIKATLDEMVEGGTYTVDFGDGSAPASGNIVQTTAQEYGYGTTTFPIVIEAAHTYTGARDTVYTATVTVKDALGAVLGSDTYSAIICRDRLNEHARIAKEEALWWLYKDSVVAVADPAHGGGQIAAIDLLNNWDAEIATILAAQGFVDSGFKVDGDADNPYTDIVKAYVNYVTERISVAAIGIKGGDRDPEQGSPYADNIGVFLAEEEDEYEIGVALRLLATCGYSTELVQTYDPAKNLTGNTSVSLAGWSYQELVQQYVDFLAWAQLYVYGTSYGYYNNPAPSKTATVVPTSLRGGWPYAREGNWSWWNDLEITVDAYGDTACTYWAVVGLKAAEAMGGISIPPFVKIDLAAFIANNQDSVGYDPVSGDNRYKGEFHFGGAYGVHLVERAGMGLVMLGWTGALASDPAVVDALAYIERFWDKDNYSLEQYWPNSNARGSQTCLDRETGLVADDCFTHFAYGPYYSAGYYDIDPETGEWIYGQSLTLDAINIMAFLTISEGLDAFGINKGNFPSNDNSIDRYTELMVSNQLPNGAWDDNGWIMGSPLGTGWGIQLLDRL